METNELNKALAELLEELRELNKTLAGVRDSVGSLANIEKGRALGEVKASFL